MPDAEVEKRFMQFVKEEYNGIAETVYSQLANAVWLFETNVTNYNEAAMVCHREERCRSRRTCKTTNSCKYSDSYNVPVENYDFS